MAKDTFSCPLYIFVTTTQQEILFRAGHARIDVITSAFGHEGLYLGEGTIWQEAGEGLA